MALDVRVDSFVKSVAAGPVDQTVTVGFQPKAIKVWLERPTADHSWTNSSTLSIGAATGPTNQFCAASSRVSNEQNRGVDAKLLIILDNDGNIIAQGKLKEFTATTFVITWEINNAIAYIISYEALGGTDLTNAFVAHSVSPPGTGNFDITGAPFTPTFAYIFHSGGVTGTLPAVDTGLAAIGIGCTDGASQWAMEYIQSFRGSSFADCLVLFTNIGEIATRAAFVQFNSDGCRINFSVNFGSVFNFFTLFLQGPKFKVGKFAKPTSTSTPVAQVITGLGLTPKILSFASVQLTTEPSGVTADGMFFLGAADGTRSRMAARTAIGAEDIDSVSADYPLAKANSSANVQAIGVLSSLNVDGFTLSWTTNDAVATLFYYIAIGTTGTPTVKTRPALYRVQFGVASNLKSTTYRVLAAAAKALSSTYRITGGEGQVEVLGYGGRRHGTQWGECARCGFFYPFPLLIIQPGYGGGAQVCIVRCLDQPSVEDLLPDELPTEQPLQFIGDAGPEE